MPCVAFLHFLILQYFRYIMSHSPVCLSAHIKLLKVCWTKFCDIRRWRNLRKLLELLRYPFTSHISDDHFTIKPASFCAPMSFRVLVLCPSSGAQFDGCCLHIWKSQIVWSIECHVFLKMNVGRWCEMIIMHTQIYYLIIYKICETRSALYKRTKSQNNLLIK